ncbi:MAG: T9SS type A sorting domain-containing protein, partial [Bacteroidia bacterium]|nr:T9SS type A sorting domain-containing protein [Bacteroidia bacterium]
YGSVYVTITPSAAVSAGATWNLDGSGSYASGYTLPNVSTGNHTVGFNNVSGWIAPASQSVNVTNGNTSTVSGTYTPITQYGSVYVTITPSAAVSAGATWNLDGSGSYASGYTLPSVSTGNHLVGFNNVSGWTAPASQSVNVTNGNTSTASGMYTQISVPDIDVTPTSLTIYEQSKKSGNYFNYIPYKITDSDLLQDKNNRGLAARVIVPKSVTENWRKNMLAKYGLNKSTIIDWSGFDSPVKNQGGCGSCWAFAAVGLLENIANQAGFGVQNLSEQVIVSCVSNHCSGGWYYNAFDYVKDNGIIPENCFPYTATNNNCANQCTNPTFVENISQFNDFSFWDILWDNPTVDDLKFALQDGPVCVAMKVYPDFYDYHSGIYNYQNGDNSSLHSVLLVGYNDNQQCFKVKNSWGTNPLVGGHDGTGYFRIAYDDVTDDVNFGMRASYAKGIYMVDSAVVSSGTFTIKNTGNANLAINNISLDEPWLSITPQTVSPLAPNESILITVTIPDWGLISGISETATITINSNDSDEPNRQVTVIAEKSTGSGTPELLISTDFYQDSELPVTNSSVTINVGVIGADTVNWNAQTSDTWLLLSPPNGVNDGVISVSYATNNTGSSRTGYVTISSSDVSNSPQVVSITQGTNHAPVISNINKTTPNLTDTVHFSNSDFINQFVDLDGNTLKHIRIVSFPEDGILEINNSPVMVYQNILENNIQDLVFIPNSGWDGNSSFEYNASDGFNHAIINANVNITYLVNSENYLLCNNIIIYPNPVKNELTIELQTSNVEHRTSNFEILNILGQSLITSTIQKKATVDMSALPSGVYLIKLNTEKSTIVKRFVKE